MENMDVEKLRSEKGLSSKLGGKAKHGVSGTCTQCSQSEMAPFP